MHKFKDKIENGMFVLDKEEFERFKEYLKEIEAENERLRKDSERYAWLREQCSGSGSLIVAKVGTWDLTPWAGDNLDRHIDEAREPNRDNQ